MQHEIEAQWMGKMQFNALVNGHTIIMDAPERVGGEDHGPIPKPFVLSALSGCTGMDVVALLRKADKTIDDLDIKVTGTISKTPPIEYVSVHVLYDFKGPADSMDAALQAVHDSQHKYCGVSHMLKKIMPVTWQVLYNGHEVFNNSMETESVNSNYNDRVN
jgi:putative redox protein